MLKNKLQTISEQSNTQEAVVMNLGKNISKLRKASGMTQEELAYRLGVSPQAVSKWENETSCPDISLLPDIAKIFGISIDRLMIGDDAVNPDGDEKTHKDEFNANSNRTIKIVVTNLSGKANTINLPFKLVKTGLKIGTKFGLSNSICEEISRMIECEEFGEIVTVDTENGDKVSISIQ